VALRQNLSLKYLEQLATALSRAGYLKSVRGAQGGYLLTRPAECITAGHIMRAAEGGFLPVTCITPETEACPRQLHCKTSQFWTGLRTAIDDYVDAVTIAELASQRDFVLL
jgi:Rrf2 family protein